MRTIIVLISMIALQTKLFSFSDSDPITKGGDILFQKLIPGCKGISHKTILGAGHFLQEDKGPELAQLIVDFIDNY